MNLWFHRDHDWQEALIWFSKPSVDGGRVSGPVMMRRVNGVKEYRAETETEAYERYAANAW